MRKSKVDQTVERMCIILSLIQKDTAFLHQGVTNYGFRRLTWVRSDVVKTNGFSFENDTYIEKYIYKII